MPYPNINSQSEELDVLVYYSDGIYIVGFKTVEAYRKTHAQIQTEIDTINEKSVIDTAKIVELQTILDGNI